LQLLDRKQQRLALVTIPVDQFVEANTNTTTKTTAMDQEPKHTIVKEEYTEFWHNISNLLYVLSDGSFIWATETHDVDTNNKQMMRHLYWLSNDGKQCHAITPTSSSKFYVRIVILCSYLSFLLM